MKQHIVKQGIFFVWIFGVSIMAYAQKPIAIDSTITTRHGPERGSLVIVGGGNMPDEIWDTIVHLAGGKNVARIVVVTNASPDTSSYIAKTTAALGKRVLSKKQVSTLRLENIREANDEKNLKELKQATAVYFEGGRQWRIADVYLNTLAHQEFWNVLARGGVIAGTSAGASIQGSFLWRGDTFGNAILISDHTQGLGFLRSSAIDQHIFVRNRQFDLASFTKIAPKLIGIGIDESTAVVVQRDDAKIIGKSYAAFYSADSENFYFLNQGDRYDLKERKVIKKEKEKKEFDERQYFNKMINIK
jgi:cyanophycinase